MRAEPRRAVALELLERDRVRKAIRSELFDKQIALHDDPAQFRAAHPGRRAGKSEGIPRSAVLNVLDAGFNEAIVIGAETKQKAVQLHWANVMALVAKHDLQLKPNLQQSSFITPFGARILFWGMSDKGAVELLRGFKVRAAMFDEVATYAPMLPRLVSHVLEPALLDTGGPLTLYGTPSVTRVGGWADICLGKTPGWSCHHWTVLQNPKFPRDAKSMLQQVLLRNNWTEDHPTFRREYMGEFVNDSAMQVFQFAPDRNEAECLPIEVSKGRVTMGVDYGTTNDACAWTALWSAHGSRHVYILESFEHYKMLPDDAADITRAMIERWNPEKGVGDGGGLGAPYIRVFNRRYGHLTERWVQPADKMGKLGQIAIVNGELGSGRIKALPAAKDLADALTVLPWKDEKREDYDPEYKHLTHLTDSFRYAAFAHMTDIPAKPQADPTPAEIEAEKVKARQDAARARLGEGFFV